MKRITKIAIAAGAALSLGLAAATVSASPFGYGPGWHMGGLVGRLAGQDEEDDQLERAVDHRRHVE